MTPSAARAVRPGLRASVARTALVVVLALLGVRAPAGAQVERLLSDREAEYEAARKEYESRLAAWDVQQRRFQAALEEVNAAKRSGDAQRQERAYQTSTAVSDELSRLKRRVDEADSVRLRAKDALLKALDARRRALLQQRARTPQEERDLLLQIRDLDNQYTALAADGGSTVRPALVFWPDVDVGPLDGIDDLRAKVGLLERKVREAQEEMVLVDEELSRLEARLALRRRTADARATLDIFDDTRVPVGPRTRGGREPSATASADTTGVPLHELPLELQIERFRTYRSQLELMEEQLRARATSIRTRLTRTGSVGGVA